MSTETMKKALIDIEDAAICLENHAAMGHAEDLRTAVAALIAERDALAERGRALEAENLHLAKFIGAGAMPRIKASLAAGLPAGGADQPLTRAEARNV